MAANSSTSSNDGDGPAVHADPERKLIKVHIQAVADTTLVTSKEELCWLAIAAASAWLPRPEPAETALP